MLVKLCCMSKKNYKVILNFKICEIKVVKSISLIFFLEYIKYLEYIFLIM